MHSIKLYCIFLLLNKLEQAQLITLVNPNRPSQEDSSLAMGNTYEPNMYYYPTFSTQVGQDCAGDNKMEIPSMHSNFLPGWGLLVL